MRPIDPIVIKEAQERNQKVENATRVARASLTALDWFGEYAFKAQEGAGPKTVDPDTLVGAVLTFGGRKIPDLIVASSTGNVDAARAYVEKAFVELRSTILTRAIELAQDEWALAERALKERGA